jgi:hypothetical protein
MGIDFEGTSAGTDQNNQIVHMQCRRPGTRCRNGQAVVFSKKDEAGADPEPVGNCWYRCVECSYAWVVPLGGVSIY